MNYLLMLSIISGLLCSILVQLIILNGKLSDFEELFESIKRGIEKDIEIREKES